MVINEAILRDIVLLEHFAIQIQGLKRCANPSCHSLSPVNEKNSPSLRTLQERCKNHAQIETSS